MLHAPRYFNHYICTNRNHYKTQAAALISHAFMKPNNPPLFSWAAVSLRSSTFNGLTALRGKSFSEKGKTFLGRVYTFSCADKDMPWFTLSLSDTLSLSLF